MSMNLFNMSKEINKINNSLKILENNNETINTDLNNSFKELSYIKKEYIHKLDILDITDEIKRNLEELEEKVSSILNFSINNTQSFERFDSVKQFLKNIDIKDNYINIYLYLKCDSIHDILLLDKQELINLEIPLDIINFINTKVNEYIHDTNLSDDNNLELEDHNNNLSDID